MFMVDWIQFFQGQWRVEKGMVAVEDIFQGDDARCDGAREESRNIGVEAIVYLHGIWGRKSVAMGVEDSRVERVLVRCGKRTVVRRVNFEADVANMGLGTLEDGGGTVFP